VSAWALGLVAAGAYAVALAALAPAVYVDALLDRSTQGIVRLSDAAGTVWAGTGWLEARDRDQRGAGGALVAWQCSPRSLIRARLACEIVLPGSTQRAELVMSTSAVEILHADVSLPASVLGAGLPRLAPLRPTGNVRLTTERASFSALGQSGSVTVEWSDAGSAISPLAPLGDYRLRLSSENGTVHAVVSTLRGPLRVDGAGSWPSGAAPVIAARARVAAEHQQALAPLLRLVAVDRGGGSFDLQLK
jgi:general secretion pathway protein N